MGTMYQRKDAVQEFCQTSRVNGVFSGRGSANTYNLARAAVRAGEAKKILKNSLFVWTE